jgi:hypothetical protein
MNQSIMRVKAKTGTYYNVRTIRVRYQAVHAIFLMIERCDTNSPNNLKMLQCKDKPQNGVSKASS